MDKDKLISQLAEIDKTLQFAIEQLEKLENRPPILSEDHAPVETQLQDIDFQTFNELFEKIIGVPSIVLFSVLQTVFEEYGEMFLAQLADDCEIDIDTLDLIREGVNTYLENEQ